MLIHFMMPISYSPELYKSVSFIELLMECWMCDEIHVTIVNEDKVIALKNYVKYYMYIKLAFQAQSLCMYMYIITQ